MKLSNYYLHGLQNPDLLKIILEKGLLSRNELIKEAKDIFSSSKDFINNEGTNGFNDICVCTYKSLSYYLFSLPNISLLIDKNDNYQIEKGGLDGEYLIKNKIPKENIKALALRLPDTSRYNKRIYEYISTIKNNLTIISKYKIVNIENSKEISTKELAKLLEYLKIKKSINILIEGPIFSGKKEIINVLSKDYKIYEKEVTNKETFIKRYKDEIRNDNIVIYKNSLIAYKNLFTKEEWLNILTELNIKERDLINNYDVNIHLYSMANKYKNIYTKMPKAVNDICREDKRIDNIWKNNNNYYSVYAKDSINNKIEEVLEILNEYI